MRAYSRLVALLAAAMIAAALPSTPARADGASHALAAGGFAQSWTSAALITASDSWSGVPSITGYRGDGLAATDGVDPQTILADGAATPVSVIANQTNPSTLTTGGVAEFELADPTVALQGSGTADAPHLVIALNALNRQSITVSYTLRDLDASADNAQQQVALQYRVGASGSFVNVPAGYVSDATSGPSLATLVTQVSAQLPAAADNQALVLVRIITTNAGGSDEWVGVDDIAIGSAPFTGEFAPTVTSTIPSAGASGVAPNATIVVTFSEPVNVSGDWFGIACASSGAHGAAVSGGPASFSLLPAQPFAPGESCTVTVRAAQVTDQDASDPPDAMAADVSWSFTTAAAGQCTSTDTPIGAVQGSGATAARSGVVTVQGVVVGDYEGPAPNLRGFYLQEVAQVDGDAATSEGIFVFRADEDDVSLGRLVQVTGTVGEFQGQTQISGVTALEDCGSSAAVAPAAVTLPLPAAIGGVDYLERFEGMLVRLPQTLYVTEHFQLGRFGQVTLSSGARLSQPTNIAAPGAAALAVQAANDRNRIILDDAQNSQNPDPIVFGRGGAPLSAANTLRGGDSAAGIVGVLTYTWAGNAASGNAWRVRPIGALGGGVPAFQPANPRPAAAPDVGGTLRVASVNLLNYFNTFGASACANGVGGAATECRGANSQAEFDRQWPKSVAVIVGSGADIIGVNELENDGYGSASALQDLVGRLNSATAPGTYAFIDADARTGQTNALGTDAIKVALIYKPATVTPVGTTAALNSGAFGLFTVMGGSPIQRNRPALAQAFQDVGGERFTVVVTHLKSKGSSCADNLSPVGPDPDAGDGQGNCNLTRTRAAQELAAWLAADPTASGDPDVLIVGDLNAYAKEDPVSALVAAGYIDMVARRSGPGGYSYAFDGQWGALDHALASATLRRQIPGAAEWHVNADEPGALDYNTDFKTPGQIASLYAADRYRASDHDPLVVGLGLGLTLDGIFLPLIGR